MSKQSQTEEEEILKEAKDRAMVKMLKSLNQDEDVFDLMEALTDMYWASLANDALHGSANARCNLYGSYRNLYNMLQRLNYLLNPDKDRISLL